ncbi:Putative trans-acting enoyl reductase [Thermoflexales bacterium]|nr:Putative trans-acting enoyl reductase [Thermoflexales bacterium]
MHQNNWLIYGANGYTGELISREAVQRGWRPVLAGRNRQAIETLAAALGLEYRIFGLDDLKAIEGGLKDCAVVLHCAGPFSHTAKPMIEACLLTHTHYLDITGEIAVFEAAATYDAVAKLAGIMLLPGVGFDVVPTDCLAAQLKGQLPSATHLALAFRGLGRTSRGTTVTALESMSTGGMIRRDGKLLPVPTAWKTRRIDFGNGQGPLTTITVPWGDVSTAYYTTGIPNIEVYVAFKPWFRRLVQSSRYFNWLLGSKPVQTFLKAQINAMPLGSTPKQRARSTSYVWGEVRDEAGHVVTARLQTPDGYTLTVLTALAVVEQALGGRTPIGFQTPARAYGPEFIFTIEGVTRPPEGST